MTKPYSEDLRIRAVEAVANGMSRRQVAKGHCHVSAVKAFRALTEPAK